MSFKRVNFLCVILGTLLDSASLRNGGGPFVRDSLNVKLIDFTMLFTTPDKNSKWLGCYVDIRFCLLTLQKNYNVPKQPRSIIPTLSFLRKSINAAIC